MTVLSGTLGFGFVHVENAVVREYDFSCDRTHRGLFWNLQVRVPLWLLFELYLRTTS